MRVTDALLVVALAALLLILVVVACAPPDECVGIPQPPPEYDHAPNIAVRIGEGPTERTDVTCQALGMTPDILACSKGQVIILPQIDGRSVTRARWACYLRHEFGHINGASADHRGWVMP